MFGHLSDLFKYFSHKQFRRLLKKERRRQKRQEAAKKREQKELEGNDDVLVYKMSNGSYLNVHFNSVIFIIWKTVRTKKNMHADWLKIVFL